MLWILLLFFPLSAFGQFTSTARHIGPYASAPAHCSTASGDIYYNTTSKTPFYCSAPDTWTAMGGSGGGSPAGPGVPSSSNGTSFTDAADFTGIAKFNGTAMPTQAIFADLPITNTNIVSKFTGCSGTQYLGADGACHAGTGIVTGGVPAGPTLSIQSNAGGAAFDGNAANIQNFSALPTPSAPVITHSGTAGLATWGYRVVCGFVGGAPLALGSIRSAQGTTATGNATLSGSNFNIITVPASVSGEASCDVYRTASGGTPATTGLIGNVANGAALNDTGLDVVGPFSALFSDHSIGVAASIPIVSQNSGSAFGSWAYANADDQSDTANTATGLGVYEHTGNPKFDGNVLLGYIGIDSDAGVNVVLGSAELFVDHASGQDFPILASFSDNGFDSGSVSMMGAIGSFSGNNMSYIIGQNFIITESGTSAGIYGTRTFVLGGGTVANLWGYYLLTPGVTVSGSAYAFYSEDLAGVSPNSYYSWFDSRGVGRCKEDNTFNSVGQSICAVYNPQFTKYTPGATDFERIVYGEWESNVAFMGPEKGGTGTLRSLELQGGGLIFQSTLVSPASSGTRYLCISTAGVVTSSASACSGT